MANDIIVSEMTSASQINTNDLMIMTQPDLLAETGYSTKKGTVLQVANKMLKGTEYLTDLPGFTDKTVLGGLEELKGDLTALLPVDTASGAIANFDTDLSLPLVDCKANIVATGGNGTPDNPNPINGYTEANITRCGVNLWDEVAESGRYDADTGIERPDASWTRSKNFIPVKSGTEIYIKSSFSIVIYCYGLDKSYISKTNRQNATFAVPSGVYYIHITWNDNAYNNDISINYPSSDTTYHAYNGQTYTIAFGQTVYGCVLDVTRGKLTVTYNYNADMISYNWTYDNTAKCWQAVISGMKSYPSRSADLIAEEWSADTSAVAGDEGKMFTVGGALYCYTADNVNKPTGELVYPLATPFDIDLTPEVISAIVGTNNVYSDTNGDTEVKYKEGIQHYIDKKIAATQALIL